LTFDSLVVSQPDFIKRTGELIETEEMSIWKDYLLWKTLRHYAGNLSERFVNESFNFYGKILSGKSEMKPLNERAIDEITNKDFGELLGKAFVEKYYSQNAQKRVNTMVDNLLFVFKQRIQNLEWMSDETKKEATNKLNSIGRKLGFPSKWENYSSLDFSSTAYVLNIKAENNYSFKKNLADLKKPIDKEKWGMPAHMVNAYYHPLLNEIAFPAGIMQPPFFDEKSEDAVNYGRIGMVIGHEFTHGFDDMGSKFAADGSFKNWWSESDRTKFEEKTTTLGETFSAFCPIEGHCVNPQLTMGENIADLGGLTMAYYAYALTDEFKSGKVLEGYTPAQRFFISYAQLWKISYTEEEMKNRIANDPHSPGMYRVNGPLKNCPEFFEAFGVKEGAAMRNPQGKVARIW
jgi:putative endopeptidase